MGSTSNWKAGYEVKEAEIRKQLDEMLHEQPTTLEEKKKLQADLEEQAIQVKKEFYDAAAERIKAQEKFEKERGVGPSGETLNCLIEKDKIVLELAAKLSEIEKRLSELRENIKNGGKEVNPGQLIGE